MTVELFGGHSVVSAALLCEESCRWIFACLCGHSLV